MTNKLIGLLILLCVISPAMSQSLINLDKLVDHPWVDSVFNSLTPDERMAQVNTPEVQLAQRQLIESALTLLENKNQIIPIQRLDTLRIAALSIGSSSTTPFQKMLGNYTKVDCFFLPENFTNAEYTAVLQKLKGYNLVITGIHSLYESKNRRSLKVGNIVHTAPERPYGVTDELETMFSRLSLMKNSLFVFFSNPYAINEIKYDTKPDGLLLAWQNTSLTQELAAQLLFGGIGSGGKLPVAIGNRYKVGDGIVINGSIRLKYTLPEEVGLNSERLSGQIDSIVNNALMQKAFPGCNVLIAKDGKVIFQKSYGYHTYDNRVPASLDDIYDLASVSKVTGALPGIMKLYEEGKCLLDVPFSSYWRDWRKRFLHPSDKGDLTVREMLAHQSGLIPFLPFWRKSVSHGQLSPKLYSVEQDQRHNLEVAPGLYISPKFKKSVYKDMRKSPLKTRGKYVYSDLSLILFPEVIAKLSGQKYTQYLDQNFYRPLGATTITYNPLRKFSTEQVVPTEYDTIYRKRLVHGSVHDESSAVLGGLAGNAGLFASANDLAKLVQMYVQYGTYGGKQYLKKSTFEEFNRVQFPQNNNRRALGFDKPSIDNQKLDREKAYPCSGPSPQSFGHFGFTGTFFWADPANGLTYIFLSNRVYPTRESNKISTLNVRTEILQVMYDELGKSTQLPR